MTGERVTKTVQLSQFSNLRVKASSLLRRACRRIDTLTASDKKETQVIGPAGYGAKYGFVPGLLVIFPAHPTRRWVRITNRLVQVSSLIGLLGGRACTRRDLIGLKHLTHCSGTARRNVLASVPHINKVLKLNAIAVQRIDIVL